MKIIYEKDAIDALHKTMLEFFKTDGDDEPEFITASEKMLLSVNKAISNALKALPSAQPEPHYDEWCTDCKEYDHEKHCCPRFNKVIRTALQDAQPEIVMCKDCKWKQGSECVMFSDVRPFPDDFCSRAERREE